MRGSSHSSAIAQQEAALAVHIERQMLHCDMPPLDRSRL
jgi:hypothetical protein